MEFRSNDADQQCEVRSLSIGMRDLVVCTSHGLRENAIDMGTERADELVKNILHVFLEFVNQQPDEVHEVNQLCRLEVRKEIRHEGWDELSNVGSCCC